MPRLLKSGSLIEGAVSPPLIAAVIVAPYTLITGNTRVAVNYCNCCSYACNHKYRASYILPKSMPAFLSLFISAFICSQDWALLSFLSFQAQSLFRLLCRHPLYIWFMFSLKVKYPLCCFKNSAEFKCFLFPFNFIINYSAFKNVTINSIILKKDFSPNKAEFILSLIFILTLLFRYFGKRKNRKNATYA